MPCYAPLRAFRSIERTESGKRKLVFNRRDGYSDMEVEISCGQCIGCRAEKSRQWAVRCMHEASLHDSNVFLTLTYDDEHLPKHGSLRKKDIQLFMKRLRKFAHPKKVRFFHSGEYGDDSLRPHYHMLLFGFDFVDKTMWTVRHKITVYRSASLEKLWHLGNSEIGTVTFESAAYVAKYCIKRLTGEEADARYRRLCTDTGELVPVEPEYATMSRRPGIGREWYERYGHEVHRDDSVIVNGREQLPPKYYDDLAEVMRPDVLKKVKHARKRGINEEEQAPTRLTHRELHAIYKRNFFKRRGL